VGFASHAHAWSEPLRGLAKWDAAKQLRLVLTPFGLAASVILASGWIVAIFYCLDALHGERRDRSILFWKSMPVSDRATVASKAAIPFAVIPLVAVGVALATQLVLLAIASGVLAAKGLDAAIPWTHVPWGTTWIGMIYGMAAHTLWFAPIFAWLLLVSGWARRSPFLWAFLPAFGAAALERIAFGSTHVADFLKYRVVGGMQAFSADTAKEPIVSLSQLDPARFLSIPGLWLGLAFAFACLAIAVRLRRRRDPT
jgi:ABC-2 type transport system permease protein